MLLVLWEVMVMLGWWSEVDVVVGVKGLGEEGGMVCDY